MIENFTSIFMYLKIWLINDYQLVLVSFEYEIFKVVSLYIYFNMNI